MPHRHAASRQASRLVLRMASVAATRLALFLLSLFVCLTSPGAPALAVSVIALASMWHLQRYHQQTLAEATLLSLRAKRSDRNGRG